MENTGKFRVVEPKLKTAIIEQIYTSEDKFKKFGKLLDKLRMKVEIKNGFHIVSK